VTNSTKQSVNPWKGLHFYTEDDQGVFFGREKEVLDLLRFLNRDCLTILFARSGMGKTSLLRAGLIPKLRKDNYLPVIVRIIPGDEAESPSEQIIHALQQAASQNEVDIETLADCAGGVPETLWEYLHRHRFWGKRNDPIRPIVILDQFEELFTLGLGSQRTTTFLEELADVVENRMPSRLQQHLEGHGQKLSYEPRFHDYRIFLSLREDFVPFLDRLQPGMPAVMRNRYCLEPLLWSAAVEIVKRAGGPYVKGDVAELIATAVTAARTNLDANSSAVPVSKSEVEPAYLSVMCHELFRRMVELNEKQISAELVSGESGSILSSVFNRSFETLAPGVRVFVEDRLLSASGYRLTLPLEEAYKAGVSHADLEHLVNQRLLRFEYRLATTHVELSHDLLREIVVRSRTRREQELAEGRRKQQEEEIKQKLRKSRALAWAGATTTAALVAGIGIYLLGFKIDSSSYSADFTKKWGVPYPIRRLPWKSEQHREATIRITSQGWWGLVKKLEIINSNGELTDNHNVKTYLAKEESSNSPSTKFAYIEYTYDKDGRLVFETSRKRNATAVTSLAYTIPPPYQATTIVQGLLHRFGLYRKLDAKATAKAIYLGPDGFPLPQRQSKAEYIQFTYDNKGHEVRHDYLSISNERMPGPDNAYGRTFNYDAEGRVVKQTSLGMNGTPINDKAQNASLEVKYNSSGDLIEARALDVQDEPTIVISGYYFAQFNYDKYGRRTQAAFFSPSGKRVREKKDFGAHLIKYDYDNKGNTVKLRAFDEEYKPTTPKGGDILYPVHEVRFAYNSLNQQTLIALYDEDKKRTSSIDGWHEQRLTYDKSVNDPKSISYFNQYEKPIAHSLTGAHREDYIIDKFGQPVELRYRDILNRPMNSLDGGYHRQLLEYNPAGNITRRRYFNTSGAPVSETKLGAHEMRAVFDRYGNQLSESYADAKGQPVIGKQGYHKMQATYNNLGKVEEEIWLNEKNEPVRGPNGVSNVRYDYDNKGLLLQVRHIHRPIYKLMADNHGVAEVRNAYNSKQQITKEQFFGPNGKPAEGPDGNHLILQEYDAKGRQTQITMKRKDGRPNLYPAFGVATKKQIFDIDGDWVEDVNTDSIGNLVVGPFGYARGAITHGPGNRKVLVNYGANGKIALNKLQGFARKVLDTSSGSLVAELSIYGPDGALINGQEGYAEVRRLRSKTDDILQEVFYGPGGHPAVGPQGFHRMVKTSSKSQPLYFDKQNNALLDFNPNNPDSRLFAEIIYIHEIFSPLSPASLSGLRVGDIVWSYGGWSYAQSRKKLSALGRDPDMLSIANDLPAEIRRRSQAFTEATILRDGVMKTIPIPPLPEKKLGVNFRSRVVPLKDLPLWRLGLQ
jgi:hypothetical protein